MTLTVTPSSSTSSASKKNSSMWWEWTSIFVGVVNYCFECGGGLWGKREQQACLAFFRHDCACRLAGPTRPADLSDVNGGMTAMQDRPMSCRLMNCALAMQAVLVAAAAMSFTATAETVSPRDLRRRHLQALSRQGFKGLALSSEADIRRYFAPPLSDAIVKDFAAAHKAGECHCSTAIHSSTRRTGRSRIPSEDRREVRAARTPRSATVAFVMFMRAAHGDARSRRCAGGLADRRRPVGSSGSLRALYKLKRKPMLRIALSLAASR